MDRRDDILRSAQRLFARHGLKKVTTDDIARDARVSKATIYKRYRNKRQILEAVIRLELDSLFAHIREAVAAETTTEGRMRAHLLTKISTIHEFTNLDRVTREAMTEIWDQATELRQQCFREEAGILAEILTAGVEAGELAIDDVPVMAHLMVVSLQALQQPEAIAGLGLTVQQQVEHMLGVMLNGMRRRN